MFHVTKGGGGCFSDEGGSFLSGGVHNGGSTGFGGGGGLKKIVRWGDAPPWPLPLRKTLTSGDEKQETSNKYIVAIKIKTKYIN